MTAATVPFQISSAKRRSGAMTSMPSIDEVDQNREIGPTEPSFEQSLSQETFLKIQQMQKRLARDQRSKMKQVMTICVFGTPHAFDPDEVIFELEMENDTPCYEFIGEQTHCFCCKEKLKKTVQCQFCAMKYCPDCRMRQRAFPNSIVLDNGEKLLGKICKICDRKFLMLEQYKR